MAKTIAIWKNITIFVTDIKLMHIKLTDIRHEIL